MIFTLPKLNYSYEALEPSFDARTMELHHSKHHQGYVDKLNQTLKPFPELQEKTLEELLTSLDSLPEEIQTPVRNFGGGHYNHSLFWTILTPQQTQPSAQLSQAINTGFGSFDQFSEKFKTQAGSLFGSGWVWLVKNQDSLEIVSTANQDTPLSAGKNPLLTLDLWEHAYYLKYQNRRPEFINAFFELINWETVSDYYSQT